MDIERVKKVYMIGIKGVGMTMLAQYLKALGKDVVGSDIPDVFMTDKVLKQNDIKVIENFNASNIPSDADLIVYSSAYNESTNEELRFAKESGKKFFSFAETLGMIFNKHYGIAVVGSHGKTTTSAWLGYVLWKAGMNPSVFVGSHVPQFNGSSLSGVSDYVVSEMDEYQNKLRYYEPKMILLNNIDYDHPDFFPTPEDYQTVFIDFIKKLSSKGFLVTNYDDAQIRKLAQVNCRAKLISYAIHESADYVAYDIKKLGSRQYFKVKMDTDDENAVASDTELGGFSIQLSGEHNISNALAVIAASIELGIDLNTIRLHLEEFSGTDRRMEVLGRFRGATIIDDYAHHHTEIKSTIAGVRDLYPDNYLRVVFHPHTYTRTKTFLNEFSMSFDQADEILVLDIYGSAREKQGGVHSRDLVAKIEERGKMLDKSFKVKYIGSLKICEEYLRQSINRDDIVLLMGAGDVFRIGENLIEK